MHEPAANAPETETEAKKSRGLGSYVVWGLAVVMVYVLSSGPAIRYILWNASGPAAAPLTYLFSPLICAYNSHSVVHKPIGMYWHLWVPTSIDPKGRMM